MPGPQTSILSRVIYPNLLRMGMLLTAGMILASSFTPGSLPPRAAACLLFPFPINSHIEQQGNTWRIFSYPKYYRNEFGQYMPVDPTFRPSAREGFDWEVTAGIYSLWVGRDGAFAFRHAGDERVFKLEGIAVRHKASGREELSFPIDLSSLAPTVSGDTITWDDPATGLSYSIRYVNDQLIDRLTLPESVKGALWASIPAAWAGKEAQIAVRYTCSPGSITAAIAESRPGALVYRDQGTGAPLHWRRSHPIGYEHPDDLGFAEEKFWRDKIIEGDHYYDAVPAEALAVPARRMIFNDTVYFGDRGGEDYSGTQDGRLQGPGSPWNVRNYGATVEYPVGCYNWFGDKVLYYPYLAFDLDAFHDAYPTARITGATLSLYAKGRVGTEIHTVSLYPLLNDYGNPSGDWDVEEGTKNEATAGAGEVCWDYRHYNTVAWNTAGAQACAYGVNGDEASDYDGSYDRGYSALATTICEEDARYYEWEFNSLGLDVLQYQKEHPGHRYGFLLMSNIDELANKVIVFSSAEYSDTSKRPQFTITFTDTTIDSVGLYESNESTLLDAGDAMTPQTEYAVKVTLSDPDTLADISEVRITLFFDPAGQDTSAPVTADTRRCAIITWTPGGGWGMEPSSDTSWVFVTAASSAPSLTLTTGSWWAHFKPGKVATESAGSGDWDIHVKVTDSESFTVETYARDYEMNWYGEIVVGTASFDWGEVALGSGFAGNEQNGISVSYVSNGRYARQIKASSSWSGSPSGSVSLASSGTPPAGHISLKADNDALVFYDDFETGDFSRWDSAPSPWGLTNTEAYEGSYSAYAFGDPATVSKTLSTLTRGWITARAEFGETNKYHYPFYNSDYLLVAKSDGHFGYFSGTWPYSNLPTDTTYSADTWYECKVYVDLPDDRYRVYINGADKGWITDNAQVNADTDLSPFSFLNALSGDTGTMYVDLYEVRRTASLDTAVLVTADYATFDTGLPTGEEGVTDTSNTVWLRVGSSGVPNATFSGTLYYRIADAS